MANSRSSKRRLSAPALIAAAMLASGAIAAAPAWAPAVAQKPAPAPALKLNKDMVKPYNAAMAAMNAQNWAEAKTQLDAAGAAAKTPEEKVIVEQQRLRVFDALKDGPGQLAAVKAALDTGALSPEASKAYRGALGQLYLQVGDNQNAYTATKAYFDEFGGKHADYAQVSALARKVGDNDAAVTYAQKAIDAAKQEGVKPPESYYRQIMAIYAQSKQMDKYYAFEEVVNADYPNPQYWAEMITRARAEPGYPDAAKDIRLDVFRALMAAGVKLKPDEVLYAASEAMQRVLPTEAAAILKPAVDAGVVGGASDPKAADVKSLLSEAESKSALESKGLAAEEKSTLAKGSGADLAALGEVYYTHGDYAKAVDLIQKGLAKGIPDADKADIAKLHLGMAQLKAGQKDAAVATWNEVKSRNGSAVLAHNWVLISKQGG